MASHAAFASQYKSLQRPRTVRFASHWGSVFETVEDGWMRIRPKPFPFFVRPSKGTHGKSCHCLGRATCSTTGACCMGVVTSVDLV